MLVNNIVYYITDLNDLMVPVFGLQCWASPIPWKTHTFQIWNWLGYEIKLWMSSVMHCSITTVRMCVSETTRQNCIQQQQQQQKKKHWRQQRLKSKGLQTKTNSLS